MDVLEEINMSFGRKNNFSEAALEKILDHNLPQKYSQMGRLTSRNIITDGFYDYGQVSCIECLLAIFMLSPYLVTQARKCHCSRWQIIQNRAKLHRGGRSHPFLHSFSILAYSDFLKPNREGKNRIGLLEAVIWYHSSLDHIFISYDKIDLVWLEVDISDIDCLQTDFLSLKLIHISHASS